MRSFQREGVGAVATLAIIAWAAMRPGRKVVAIADGSQHA